MTEYPNKYSPVLFPVFGIRQHKKMTRSNKQTLYISFSFLAVLLIGFFPFYANGRTMIWNLDGAGQYYPAFLYIGRWLRSTITALLHGSLDISFFNLQIGMGEDVIGCLNYYGLGDPLNLLAVFAAGDYGAILFSAMYFLRLALADMAFLAYCR